MCAIIDNNVRHEAFGAPDAQTEAGQFFLAWVDSGKGRLVVGGKLLEELSEYWNFSRWFRRARRSGQVLRVSDDAVNAETTG